MVWDNIQRYWNWSWLCTDYITLFAGKKNNRMFYTLKAQIHTSAVRNLRYGWWAYALGERATSRFKENSKIISIDGNLASGKGALAQKLADKLGKTISGFLCSFIYVKCLYVCVCVCACKIKLFNVSLIRNAVHARARHALCGQNDTGESSSR